MFRRGLPQDSRSGFSSDTQFERSKSFLSLFLVSVFKVRLSVSQEGKSKVIWDKSLDFFSIKDHADASTLHLTRFDRSHTVISVSIRFRLVSSSFGELSSHMEASVLCFYINSGRISLVNNYLFNVEKLTFLPELLQTFCTTQFAVM